MFRKSPLTKKEAVQEEASVAKKLRKQTTAHAADSYASYNQSLACPDGSVVITPWNSDEGKERLIVSKYSGDFFMLAHVYQAQKNPFYCGVAAMTMTLNGLRLDKGMIPSQPDLHYHHFDNQTGEMHDFAYRMYSQMTLLDEETDRIKDRKEIAPKNYYEHTAETRFNPGLNLHEVCQILDLYEVETTEHHADDTEDSMAQFRYMLTQKLVNSDHIVIINFDGKIIGLDIGGHFAVVGAYHQASDSVLVLDPAGHNTPWYWVPVSCLYNAMNTVDDSSGQKRGYLVVSERPSHIDEWGAIR